MLEVFFGTMSAGKSTKLLQDRYNYTQKNKDVWVIKPSIDRTSEPKIINKFGLECPAEIMKEIKEIYFYSIKQILKKKDHILFEKKI